MNEPAKETLEEEEREALPFFVEFVKFSAAFAVIVGVGLVALHMAGLAATV